MTSREKTAFLPLEDSGPSRPLSEKLFTVAWGAIQWPWLARSLWGGKLADKHALLDRLGLPHDALPHLGSWKADTYFLWRIVEAIERLRPREVVELGCGASTLVLAKALELNGGGRLSSYDQHADFVEIDRALARRARPRRDDAPCADRRGSDAPGRIPGTISTACRPRSTCW